MISGALQAALVGVTAGGFYLFLEMDPEVMAAKGLGCRIKGNISSGGEHIYHVPGGEFYSETRISASRGERWFCTEDDARAAGWRPSRR